MTWLDIKTHMSTSGSDIFLSLSSIFYKENKVNEVERRNLMSINYFLELLVINETDTNGIIKEKIIIVISLVPINNRKVINPE